MGAQLVALRGAGLGERANPRRLAHRQPRVACPVAVGLEHPRTPGPHGSVHVGLHGPDGEPLVDHGLVRGEVLLDAGARREHHVRAHLQLAARVTLAQVWEVGVRDARVMDAGQA